MRARSCYGCRLFVTRRHHLTPSPGSVVPGVRPTRRAGGARHNVSYRVEFSRDGAQHPGWALNISRGGIRAVLEAHLEIGEEYEILVGDELVRRRGRVVWTQEEPDGTIVGVEFLERLEEAPEGIDLDASLEVPGPGLAARFGMSPETFEALTNPEGDDPTGADHDGGRPPNPAGEADRPTKGGREGSGDGGAS